MTKYFMPLIGLALLGGIPFVGHAPTEAKAGDQACCKCCPRCGCPLVPVCHIYCDTKKVTDYVYTCGCKEICVPGIRRCGEAGCDDACGGGNGSGQCGGSCNTCNTCNNGGQGNACNNGCQDGCGGCRCKVHEVHKLMKCPCTKCEPVRKCSVTWTCPHCGACCNGGNCCGSVPAPAGATTVPPAPTTVPAPPARTMLPPMPPKSTNS
jgi:hypothetical protein